MTRRRTGRQRAASRRNLAKARRVRAHDTLGFYLRAGIRKAASVPTMGVSGKVNTWVNGDYRKKKSKHFRSGN